jgi:hypothetical protein
MGEWWQRFQQWRRDRRGERYLFWTYQDVEYYEIVTVESYEQIIYRNATIGSIEKVRTETYLVTRIEETDSGAWDVYGEPYNEE